MQNFKGWMTILKDIIIIFTELFLLSSYLHENLSFYYSFYCEDVFAIIVNQTFYIQ